MSSEGARPPPSAPIGRALRWGFVAVALADALASLALHPEASRGPGGPAALALAFAAGHVIALGLVASALADLGARLLPRRRWAAPIGALALAFVAGLGVFVEDFSVFPWPLRLAATVAAASPFAAVVALRARIAGSRRLAALAFSLANLAVVTSHVVVDGSYPGIHLAANLLAGVLAGLALLRVVGPRVTGAAAVALDGGLALAAAIAVAVWPSNAVLVALARLPTASLVPFLARVHEGRAAASVASAHDAADWFRRRDDAPPVPPTRPPLAAAPPIVVLLTVDALRADVVLGDGEGAAEATKNLRRLAARGASFTQARSPASSTSPSIAAMFTGKYYSSLFCSEREERGKLKVFLPEEPTPRFPELLRAAGVETAYVVTAGGFEPEYGVAKGMSPLGEEKAATAAKVIPRIVDWLPTVGERGGFVWSHVLDPHYPYVKGPKDGAPRERWLGEVAEVDRQIGKLVAGIARAGLEDRVVLIVSADHGEAFGEHGTKTHAHHVYEELVRVPLIVVGPRIVARAIDEPASLMDVGPTVLDLFGLETPGHHMGQSLVPLLAGRDVQLTRPIVLDAGRRKQAIVWRDGIKAIRNVRQRTTELYDLRADPGETENLVDERPELAAERLGQLRAFFDAHELRRPGYEIPFRE